MFLFANEILCFMFFFLYLILILSKDILQLFNLREKEKGEKVEILHQQRNVIFSFFYDNWRRGRGSEEK